MTVQARVTFEYGIDDLADVSARNVDRLASARATARNTVLIAALLVGIAGGAVSTLQKPGDVVFALVGGALCATAFAILLLLLRPGAQRAAVRRQLLEQWGPGPFTCIVELHDDQMLWREERGRLHLELRVPWAELREIRTEGEDWVVESRTGVSMLRGRAFVNTVEADAFFATLERLSATAAARVAGPGARA